MATVSINEFDIIVLNDKVDGKRHRLSTGKKSNARLLTWYKKHFEDEFKKLYVKKFGSPLSALITFKDYGEMVLDVTSDNRNEFSQREETQRFNKLCETFGDVDISDISVSSVLRWQKDSKFSPKTIRNYRSIFGQIMKMALYDELINKNPLEFAKAPKKVKKEVSIFSEDEVRLLISKTDGQFKNVLQFNFFQGLRGSELIALRWSNVDFKNNLITVDTRIREGIEDETKSKTVRVLDILPQANEALIRQRRLTGIKDDYIFVTQYSKPYRTPDTLTVKLKTVCDDLGIKRRPFHDTRKTCNTLYKQYGMNNDWVLSQLGHVEDGVNREFYTGRIVPDFSEIGRVLVG